MWTGFEALQRALLKLSFLIFTEMLEGSYFPHFRDKENEILVGGLNGPQKKAKQVGRRSDILKERRNTHFLKLKMQSNQYEIGG